MRDHATTCTTITPWRWWVICTGLGAGKEEPGMLWQVGVTRLIPRPNLLEKWNSVPWTVPPSDSVLSFFPTRPSPPNDSTNELIDHPTLFKPFQPLFKLEYSCLGSVGHETFPRLLFQTLHALYIPLESRCIPNRAQYRSNHVYTTVQNVARWLLTNLRYATGLSKRRTLEIVFKFVLG